MTTSRRTPATVAPFAVSSLTAVEGAVLVNATGADNSAALPAGASPDPTSIAILGLSLQAVVPAQTGADVVTSGIFPGVAAGSIIVAAPGAGLNVATIGYAMESASSGERVAIDIRIGSLQG